MANLGAFKEAVIPLYHRHFDGGEIKKLLRFYATDLGRKTIRVMPSLVSESMPIGQQWGKTLGPAIEQRLRLRLQKEGYKL